MDIKIKHKEKNIDSYLCLNHICNQNCIFCIDDPTNKPEECVQLTFDEVKRFIIKNYKGTDTLELNGGEPTLHHDILNIISFASKYYHKISLSTNGIKFSDIIFTENILKAGLSNIGIPIYSYDPKIHDQIVNKNGAFDLLYKALKNLFLLKGKYNLSIHIKLLLTKLNYKENSKIIDFLLKEKFLADLISFNGLRTGEKVLKNKNTTFISFKETKREINETVEKILNLNCVFYIHEIPLCILNPSNLLKYIIKGKSFKDNKSFYLKPKFEEGLTWTEKLIFPFCEDCIVFDMCNKIYKPNSQEFDYSGLIPVEYL